MRLGAFFAGFLLGRRNPGEKENVLRPRNSASSSSTCIGAGAAPVGGGGAKEGGGNTAACGAGSGARPLAFAPPLAPSMPEAAAESADAGRLNEEVWGRKGEPPRPLGVPPGCSEGEPGMCTAGGARADEAPGAPRGGMEAVPEGNNFLGEPFFFKLVPELPREKRWERPLKAFVKASLRPKSSSSSIAPS